MATNVMLDGLDIIQSDVIKNIKIVDSAPVKLSLDFISNLPTRQAMEQL